MASANTSGASGATTPIMTTTKVQTGNLYQMVNMNVNGVSKNLMIPVGTHSVGNTNQNKDIAAAVMPKPKQPTLQNVIRIARPLTTQQSICVQQTSHTQQPSRLVIVKPGQRSTSEQSLLKNSTSTVKAIRQSIIHRPTATSVSSPPTCINSIAPRTKSVVYVTHNVGTSQQIIRFGQPTSNVKSLLPVQPAGNVLRFVQPSGLVSHIPKHSLTPASNATSTVSIITPLISNAQPKSGPLLEQETVNAESADNSAEPHDNGQLQRISPINICPCDDDALNDDDNAETNIDIAPGDDCNTSVIHGDNMQVRIAGEIVRQMMESDGRQTEGTCHREGTAMLATTDTNPASRSLMSTLRPQSLTKDATEHINDVSDAIIENSPAEPHTSAGTTEAQSQDINDSTESIRKCTVLLEKLDPRIKVPVDVNLYESFCRSDFNQITPADSLPKKSRRKQPKPRCISKSESSLPIANVTDTPALTKTPLMQSLLQTFPNKSPVEKPPIKIHSSFSSSTISQIASKATYEVVEPNKSPVAQPPLKIHSSPVLSSMLHTVPKVTTQVVEPSKSPDPKPPLKIHSSPLLSTSSPTVSKATKSVAGHDKSKFLMIKTNAGTFLVPMAAPKSKTPSIGMVSAANANNTSAQVTKQIKRDVQYKSILQKSPTDASGTSKIQIKTETPTVGYADDQVVTKQNYFGPPAKCRKLSSDTAVTTASHTKSSDKIKELKERLKRQETLVNVLRQKRSKDSSNSDTIT